MRGSFMVRVFFDFNFFRSNTLGASFHRQTRLLLYPRARFTPRAGDAASAGAMKVGCLSFREVFSVFISSLYQQPPDTFGKILVAPSY